MEYKYKPGQVLPVKNVKNASAVGYLGSLQTICDYIKTPSFVKMSDDGEPMYLCQGEDGYCGWWYESEFEAPKR